MRKNFFCIIMALGLLAGLIIGNHAQTAEAAQKKKIGVAVTNFNDKWLSYFVDAMRSQAKKYPNYELIFADGNEDVGKQIGQNR